MSIKEKISFLEDEDITYITSLTEKIPNAEEILEKAEKDKKIDFGVPLMALFKQENESLAITSENLIKIFKLNKKIKDDLSYVEKLKKPKVILSIDEKEKRVALSCSYDHEKNGVRLFWTNLLDTPTSDEKENVYGIFFEKEMTLTDLQKVLVPYFVPFPSNIKTQLTARIGDNVGIKDLSTTKDFTPQEYFFLCKPELKIPKKAKKPVFTLTDVGFSISSDLQTMVAVGKAVLNIKGLMKQNLTATITVKLEGNEDEEEKKEEEGDEKKKKEKEEEKKEEEGEKKEGEEEGEEKKKEKEEEKEGEKKEREEEEKKKKEKEKEKKEEEEKKKEEEEGEEEEGKKAKKIDTEIKLESETNKDDETQKPIEFTIAKIGSFKFNSITLIAHTEDLNEISDNLEFAFETDFNFGERTIELEGKISNKEFDFTGKIDKFSLKEFIDGSMKFFGWKNFSLPFDATFSEVFIHVCNESFEFKFKDAEFKIKNLFSFKTGEAIVEVSKDQLLFCMEIESDIVYLGITYSGVKFKFTKGVEEEEEKEEEGEGEKKEEEEKEKTEEEKEEKGEGEKEEEEEKKGKEEKVDKIEFTLECKKINILGLTEFKVQEEEEEGKGEEEKEGEGEEKEDDEDENSISVSLIRDNSGEWECTFKGTHTILGEGLTMEECLVNASKKGVVFSVKEMNLKSYFDINEASISYLSVKDKEGNDVKQLDMYAKGMGFEKEEKDAGIAWKVIREILPDSFSGELTLQGNKMRVVVEIEGLTVPKFIKPIIPMDFKKARVGYCNNSMVVYRGEEETFYQQGLNIELLVQPDFSENEILSKIMECIGVNEKEYEIAFGLNVNTSLQELYVGMKRISEDKKPNFAIESSLFHVGIENKQPVVKAEMTISFHNFLKPDADNIRLLGILTVEKTGICGELGVDLGYEPALFLGMGKGLQVKFGRYFNFALGISWALVPFQLGFGMEVSIGTKTPIKAKVDAMCHATDPEKNLFAFCIKNLSVQSIFNAITEFVDFPYVDLPTWAVDLLSIELLDITICSGDMEFGIEKTHYSKGISAKFIFALFGVKGFMVLEINDSTLKFNGIIKEIELAGFLKISCSETKTKKEKSEIMQKFEDSNPGLKLDSSEIIQDIKKKPGPYALIEISREEKKLALEFSGMTKLFGSTVDVDVKLNDDGYYFKSKIELGLTGIDVKAFLLELALSCGFSDKTLAVKGLFQQNFVEFLIECVKKGMGLIKKFLGGDMEKREKVLDDEIKSIKKNLGEERDNKIGAMTSIGNNVEKKINGTKNQLHDYNKCLESVKNTVDGVDELINTLNKLSSSLSLLIGATTSGTSEEIDSLVEYLETNLDQFVTPEELKEDESLKSIIENLIKKKKQVDSMIAKAKQLKQNVANTISEMERNRNSFNNSYNQFMNTYQNYNWKGEVEKLCSIIKMEYNQRIENEINELKKLLEVDPITFIALKVVNVVEDISVGILNEILKFIQIKEIKIDGEVSPSHAKLNASMIIMTNGKSHEFKIKFDVENFSETISSILMGIVENMI